MSDNNIDMDAVFKQMEASYSQHATKEKEEQILRKRGKGKDVEQAKTDWNRHMSTRLEIDRSESTDLFCNCGHCTTLPYASYQRENFCCRDKFMSRKTTWNANLMDIMNANPIRCITEWESFKKVVIEKEVLFSHLQFANMKNKEARMKRSDMDNKNYRYLACNVYTSLIHGEKLGYGVRLELPNCVRSAIISAFPESSGLYSRFEAVNGEEYTLADFERNAMSEYCDVCESVASRVHRFPKDPNRAWEWVKSLKWEDKSRELLRDKLFTSFFVCSGHFTKESYRNRQLDQPLVHGAVPTIITPIIISTPTVGDHAYLADHQTTVEENNSMNMEVDMEEELQQVPLPQRFSSQQSQQTDITWNTNVTGSAGPMGERFMDTETIMEREMRRRDENRNMNETGFTYSFLAHASLLELLDLVPGCLKCRNIAAKRTFTTKGTAIEMHTNCPNCLKWSWCSSRKVHDDRLGAIIESNMDLSIAAFACGIPYDRLDDMCTTLKLGIPRKKTFHEIVGEHIKPVVDTMYEECMEDSRLVVYDANQTNKVQQSKKVAIGDAQYDSRGFSASVCRYIVMDYTTRMIIDFEVQMKRENQGNSPIMESRAFANIMERLNVDSTFDIARVTTDKNASVIAHLHKKYPQVQHRLDKWHVIKLVKKHYLAVFERVKNSNLRAHWEQLLIHIWVSIETADGNAEFAVELIRSAEYHLQGIHDMPQDKFKIIKTCMHGVLIDDPNKPRAYLDPILHKAQISVLHEMLNSDAFLDNVRRCAARETTSPCESFHSLAALIYLKKNTYYDKSTTTTLTKLCCMHHNSHRMEILDRARSGIQPPTRKKYSRAQKRIREIVNQPKPKLEWKRQLLQRVKQHYREKKQYRIANRSTGRPKALHPPPSVLDHDISDDDDVDVDVTDDEPETEECDENDNDNTDELDEEDKSLPPPDSTCSLVYQPILPKATIKVSPRQFEKVYKSMGADADNYIYVHNRTGDRLLISDLDN